MDASFCNFFHTLIFDYSKDAKFLDRKEWEIIGMFGNCEVRLVEIKNVYSGGL